MSPARMEQNNNQNDNNNNVKRRRFTDLRSVQWRVDLAILPLSSSIDDLRRATADSRRRYASMRRRLLVDPQLSKEGRNSPDLVMDNPLSQNPDSTWGRFFRNAELEKMVDQDLSRLYPEHGSYFQNPGCQGMLRRILLLWCLGHPELGYRQGMHELLAPLLYVLHIDMERFSEVRKLYEDHFTDKFDGLSYHENDLTYSFDIKRFSDSTDDDMGSSENVPKVKSLDELDPEIQTIVLLTDAYGAEGELGIVFSEKFMEHDAYCMFEALMSGNHGSVAMADFFALLPSGLSPVIEASAALYHLLSVVDSSLHSHLVELGVEPQYFALRWLRVLFGREFSLDDLLIVWDEIFAADNSKTDKDKEDECGSSFGILSSPRGALISAMAVSMMLYLRSSLLATENATSCLQKLLNFPETINLKKIVDKAKSLQVLAMDINISSSNHPLSGAHARSRSMDVRSHTPSTDSLSPKTPLSTVPDSYWEEKWRVLHKAEQLKQSNSANEKRTVKKGWTEKVRLSLSRTESDPSHIKARHGKKESNSSVRRTLLDDLSRQLGLDEDAEKTGSLDVLSQEHPATDVEVERENGINKGLTYSHGERCFSGNGGSEENSPVFSDPSSPVNRATDHENDSEKSSVASNMSLDENDEYSKIPHVDSPVPISFAADSGFQISDSASENAADSISQKSDSFSQNSQCYNDSTGNSLAGAKERKFGKFHWLWKFGRNASGEGTSQIGGIATEATKSTNKEMNRGNASGSSNADVSHSSVSSSNGKGDTVDQNVMCTLKNLGNSMLEHIQVIESVFQQDRGQVSSLESLSKNVLVGKGQVTAMSALSELRKISNLLSEM